MVDGGAVPWLVLPVLLVVLDSSSPFSTLAPPTRSLLPFSVRHGYSVMGGLSAREQRAAASRRTRHWSEGVSNGSPLACVLLFGTTHRSAEGSINIPHLFSEKEPVNGFSRARPRPLDAVTLRLAIVSAQVSPCHTKERRGISNSCVIRIMSIASSATARSIPVRPSRPGRRPPMAH